MSSLLPQLQSSEATLLMYLCGELPVADQAEVERLLAHDAALAEELERLRELHGQCLRSLERLDESQRIQTAPAARNALRAVRRWRLERQAAAKPMINESSRRWRWRLTYPLSAAAALLVGMSIWWSNMSVTSTESSYFTYTDPPSYLALYEQQPEWASEDLMLAEQQSLMLASLELDEPLFPFLELIEEITN